MRAGNGHNLDYKEGFKKEAEDYEKYKGLIRELLGAEYIEPSMRSIMDKTSGIDAVALIDGIPYGVSLRCRNCYKDYNSFTLSRHITDPISEVNKWLRVGEGLKPSYHIQITALPDDSLRVIKVHIGTFKYVLQDEHLERYYNSGLAAYEFPTKDFSFSDGVSSQIVR